VKSTPFTSGAEPLQSEHLRSKIRACRLRMHRLERVIHTSWGERRMDELSTEREKVTSEMLSAHQKLHALSRDPRRSLSR
jgi:hypothetical protein